MLNNSETTASTPNRKKQNGGLIYFQLRETWKNEMPFNNLNYPITVQLPDPISKQPHENSISS